VADSVGVCSWWRCFLVRRILRLKPRLPRSGALSNGRLALRFDKRRFSLFREVLLDGQPIIREGDAGDIVVEDGAGKRYYASSDLKDPPKLTDADYRGEDAYLKTGFRDRLQKLVSFIPKARWGRLLISGTAPTFDGVTADLHVGSLSLYALHTVLEYGTIGTEEHLALSDHVFMAAHRAALDGRWGELGVSEAVVYSATIPEPAYLIPLIPYYLSQHNERENDNDLWSLDILGRPLPGLDVYGEFLVDDLQYERDTGHPDKYGATIGAAHYGSVLGSDLETRLEYSNVRKWTYTHERVEHRFAQDGRPIGFDLGPDADRVTFEVVLHPSVTWSTRLGLARAAGRAQRDRPPGGGQLPGRALPVQGVAAEPARLPRGRGRRAVRPAGGRRAV
jgi:hypothetical protein